MAVTQTNYNKSSLASAASMGQIVTLTGTLAEVGQALIDVGGTVLFGGYDADNTRYFAVVKK